MLRACFLLSPAHHFGARLLRDALSGEATKVSYPNLRHNGIKDIHSRLEYPRTIQRWYASLGVFLTVKYRENPAGALRKALSDHERRTSVLEYPSNTLLG